MTLHSTKFRAKLRAMGLALLTLLSCSGATAANWVKVLDGDPFSRKSFAWALDTTRNVVVLFAEVWGLRPDGGLWHNGSNLLWYAEALIDPQSGVVSAGAVNDGRDPAREPVQVGMTRAVAAVTA